LGCQNEEITGGIFGVSARPDAAGGGIWNFDDPIVITNSVERRCEQNGLKDDVSILALEIPSDR